MVAQTGVPKMLGCGPRLWPAVEDVPADDGAVAVLQDHGFVEDRETPIGQDGIAFVRLEAVLVQALLRLWVNDHLPRGRGWVVAAQITAWKDRSFGGGRGGGLVPPLGRDHPRIWGETIPSLPITRSCGGGV